MDKDLVCLTLPKPAPDGEGTPPQRANPKRRGNRYANVGERLAEQKRQVREEQMREWLADIEAYPSPGFCYFIGSTEGCIKIGHSCQPVRRTCQLRRDTPYKLTLLATVKGGRDRERYYHRLFEEHHRGGEWFDPHPDILAEIARLNAAGDASG